MPAPSTIDEFLELVRKSGVVDDKRLAAHLDKLRASGQVPAEPVKLATQLVRDGILTHFQAEQFLQGKWRRFTIGKYKVLERLGAGGMGSVYLAEHLMMRRRVAVKVLPAGKAADPSSLERFYREARAVAALDHPNIVRAYDIDQDDNLHFLVMEHVDGSSLQEIVKRTGPMDALRAAHYIRQAALGLQHAHDTAALVHRDIKPGNILVDRNGIVKVLDMGLARFFHDEEDVLTKKYDESVLGTADYLAPEQAQDSHTADIRADIYSLGGTFYFCLTGRTPFAEGTVAQKLIWHQTRQPRPIRSFRPEVPEGIVAVIDRMMAKDRNQRYQTPQEVADALAPWTQTPIPPPPENEMPQLSLAAAPRSMVGESGTLASRTPGDSPSPRPRTKNWQVGPASPAPAPTPSGATEQWDTQPALAPLPTAPVARATAPVAPSAIGNGARPQTAPAPARVAERTEAVRPAPAPAPAPAAPVQPAAAEEPTAAEEDFPNLGASPATAAAIRRRKPGEVRKPAGKRSLGLIILAAVGLLVVLGGLFVVLLLGVFSNWGSRSGEGKQVQRQPIYLSPAGGLTGALRSARPGDRIVLQDDLMEADVTVATPDITIEAEEGKKVVWKCPPRRNPKEAHSKLLMIQAAANVTVKGITFDGQDNADALIILYARCPGTRLENLKLRRPVKNSILISNCVGRADSKVVLHNLDFQTEAGRTAIRFHIFPETKALLVNRFLSIRGCDFNGPGDRITTAKKDFFDPESIDTDVPIVVK